MVDRRPQPAQTDIKDVNYLFSVSRCSSSFERLVIEMQYMEAVMSFTLLLISCLWLVCAGRQRGRSGIKVGQDGFNEDVE
jgi:hypothetical protein